MVLPVSGFLPVPLPMMIPFMGAQSLVIGKMFGVGFQYGKRKISAMSNEEFNKLTFQDTSCNDISLGIQIIFMSNQTLLANWIIPVEL